MRLVSLSKKVMGASVAAVILVGCGTQPETRVSQTKIVGGTAIEDGQNDQRRLSTVALTTDAARGGEPLMAAGKSFCTGTIIDRRTIVTAAHCTQKFDPETQQKN